MSLKAAIFDMDGLLIDSEPIWQQSHIAVLDKRGVTITADDVRAVAGRRTDEVVEIWRDKHDLRHVPNEELRKEVIQKVIDGVKLNGKALPGAQRMLQMLQDCNIPIAIASSSSVDIIDAVIEKLNIRDYLTLTYSAVNETLGKPHPGVFLTTAEKLGVKPEECVVFEDALSGIRAAIAAGMKCIAVPEDVNIDKPEFSEESHLKVASLEDIKWEDITRLFED
jgi:sugar-phosphatase